MIFSDNKMGEKIAKLNKEPRSISMLSLSDLSHVQRHTQAQNKGLEEDLPSKWKAKQTNKQKTKQTKTLLIDNTPGHPRTLVEMYKENQKLKIYKHVTTNLTLSESIG